MSEVKPYFYEPDLLISSPWSWAIRVHNRLGGANTIAKCMFAAQANMIVEALNQTTDLEMPTKEEQDAQRRG